jgi:hypothetical protein
VTVKIVTNLLCLTAQIGEVKMRRKRKMRRRRAQIVGKESLFTCAAGSKQLLYLDKQNVEM